MPSLLTFPEVIEGRVLEGAFQETANRFWRAGVEAENLLKIHWEGLQKFEAICLGTRHGPFVRKDDTRTVLFQAHHPNEPGSDTSLSPFPRIFLPVNVETGTRIPENDPGLFPLLKIPGGPDIPVF
jgi:hypothetical protein